ncbi:hypothetical protein PoB_002461600 [Plakobranchus ocellatus]|uniref:Uncharacterized protein n=1 Tax=Plakobranchus ocellatus TaxID=259542 RepID=A0AAV3ZUB8_9GAST|nr:hypothetical protein PoB_002461600 [Plakobranchus ocellatus]
MVTVRRVKSRGRYGRKDQIRNEAGAKLTSQGLDLVSRSWIGHGNGAIRCELSLLFKIFLLETVSAVLYIFGNRLIDLAFVIVFIVVSASAPSLASVGAAMEEFAPSGSTACPYSLPGGGAERNNMVSLIRPELLYQVLSYSALLRDVLLDRLQWLVADGLACSVAMARMKVRYPDQTANISCIKELWT